MSLECNFYTFGSLGGSAGLPTFTMEASAGFRYVEKTTPCPWWQCNLRDCVAVGAFQAGGSRPTSLRTPALRLQCYIHWWGSKCLWIHLDFLLSRHAWDCTVRDAHSQNGVAVQFSNNVGPETPLHYFSVKPDKNETLLSLMWVSFPFQQRSGYFLQFLTGPRWQLLQYSAPQYSGVPICRRQCTCLCNI